MKTICIIILSILSFAAKAQWEQQWSRTYNPHINSYDYVADIGTDQAGAVYAIGQSHEQKPNGSPGRTLFHTLKYNKEGMLVWKEETEAPAGYSITAKTIAVDPAGNNYAGGFFMNQNFDQWFHLRCRAADGALKWIRVAYDSASMHFKEVDCIRLDSKGNIYVKGYGYESGNGYFLFLVKYDIAGNREWTQIIPDDFYGVPEPFLIKNDEIFLTTSAFSVIKFDENGNKIWQTAAQVSLNGYAVDIAIDGQDNAYVSGTVHDSAGIGYRLVKYRADGELDWIKSDFPTFYGYGDWSVGLCIGKENEVYMGGMVDSVSERIYRIDPNGNTVWKREEIGVFKLIEIEGLLISLGYDMNADSSGYVHMLRAYDPSGTIVWSDKLEGFAEIFPSLAVLHSDKDHHMYAGGSINADLQDMLIIRYKNLNTGIQQQQEIGLHIYPNPVSNVLTIQCKDEGNYVLSLRDLPGREIYTATFTQIHQLNVSNLPKGLYLAEIRNVHTGQQHTEKVIIANE